ADQRAPRAAFLRASAALAEQRGERAVAFDLWNKVLEAEPLAVDANRAAALLRDESEGRMAALAYLRQVCERFPHHYALHQLWIAWLRDESAADAEAAIRRLLTIHPADAWAYRQLALSL